MPVSVVTRAHYQRGASLVLALLLSASLAGCSQDSAVPPTAHPSAASTAIHNLAPTETPSRTNPQTTRTPRPAALPTPHVLHIGGENLLTTTITVPRYNLDLPTFLRASAAEMEADTRFVVTSTRVDGDLRTDGIPVGVIRFTAITGDEATAVAGGQYAFALPDGGRFLVMTCVEAKADTDHCGDAVRRLDLAVQ